MSKFKRLVKYEAARAFAHKWWFVVIVAAIAVLFSVIAISYVKSPSLNSGETDREKLTVQYQRELEQNRTILSDYSDQLTDTEKFFVGREIEKLQFFLDSGTVESDYLEAQSYAAKTEGYEQFGFCICFCEFSSYIFMAVAVASALWAFSAETQTGTFKNLLASPMGRKSIFGVKTAISAFAVMIVPVLLFIILLIIGACVTKAPFLMYSGGYKAVSGIHVLAQLGLRNLLIIFCTYAVTLLCSVNFKPLVGALIPVLGYIGLALLAMIVAEKTNFVMLGVTAMEPLLFIPVVGLQNYLGGFDGIFIALVLVHLAVACLLIFIASRNFARKDF